MKIIPRPDELNGPYWEAAAEGRMAIQRCQRCGNLNHPPAASCPSCHGDEFDWPSMSGRGTVFTYTVVQHPVHPVMAGAIPYVLALIELEEGPRILTNLRHVRPEDVRVGLPVGVLFEQLDDATALPQFRPVDAAAGG
jgi:uncharacterized OB-fold protein